MSTKIASPGATSRSTWKPSGSIATDSRRDDVLRSAHLLVPADDERTDAERIAKREHAVAGDHRDDRVRAAAALVHAGDRREDRVGIEPMMLRGALELERQHVQQHFAVGVGVDVAEIELEQLALQLLAVGQVAVVAERHAERRIDVERLRLESAYAEPAVG